MNSLGVCFLGISIPVKAIPSDGFSFGNSSIGPFSGFLNMDENHFFILTSIGSPSSLISPTDCGSSSGDMSKGGDRVCEEKSESQRIHSLDARGYVVGGGGAPRRFLLSQERDRKGFSEGEQRGGAAT